MWNKFFFLLLVRMLTDYKILASIFLFFSLCFSNFPTLKTSNFTYILSYFTKIKKSINYGSIILILISVFSISQQPHGDSVISIPQLLSPSFVLAQSDKMNTNSSTPLTEVNHDVLWCFLVGFYPNTRGIFYFSLKKGKMF